MTIERDKRGMDELVSEAYRELVARKRRRH